MARTELVAQLMDKNGVDPVYTPANVDGHWINPGEILHVKTGDTACTVTIQTGATFEGEAVADVTSGAIPTTDERFFGSLTRNLFQQQSGPQRGKILIDFSAVTNVTVAAFKQSLD